MNGVPSICSLVFQDLIKNLGIEMGLSDTDFEFIATNAGHQSSNLNPDRGLVRFQLMEVLCRIAITKFFKSNKITHLIPIIIEKLESSKASACHRLFDDILPQMKASDSHKWRQTCLWTESCEKILKQN